MSVCYQTFFQGLKLKPKFDTDNRLLVIATYRLFRELRS